MYTSLPSRKQRGFVGSFAHYSPRAMRSIVKKTSPAASPVFLQAKSVMLYGVKRIKVSVLVGMEEHAHLFAQKSAHEHAAFGWLDPAPHDDVEGGAAEGVVAVLRGSTLVAACTA